MQSDGAFSNGLGSPDVEWISKVGFDLHSQVVLTTPSLLYRSLGLLELCRLLIHSSELECCPFTHRENVGSMEDTTHLSSTLQRQILPAIASCIGVCFHLSAGLGS